VTTDSANEMPVVSVLEWPDFSLDQYDEVIAALGYRDDESEPGGIYHTVASGDGVYIVDVWKSPDVLAEFAETRLGPVLASLQIPPPARQNVYPVHNLIIPPGALDAAPAGALRALFFIPDATAEQYEQIIRDLDAAGLTHPAGRILHVAAPSGDGWFVMDLWESQEAFESFGQTLMPLIAKSGMRIDVPPVVTPLHNTLHQPADERSKDIAAGRYTGSRAGNPAGTNEKAMTHAAFAAPVLPGKEAQADSFFAELQGSRNADFNASRRRLGIREISYRQVTPQGMIVIVTIEGDDPAEALSRLARENDDFTSWFVQQVKEIHGLDLTEPLPSTPTVIVDSGSEQERNKHVVQRFFDEVINRHDVSALTSLAGPGYLNYIAVRPEPFTLDEVYAPLQMFFDAFPDMHHHLEETVAENDLVTTKWTITATHTGAFQGIPPTGRAVSLKGISLYRLADGKIIEDYPGFSPLDILAQIGVIPLPEAQEQPV